MTFSQIKMSGKVTDSLGSPLEFKSEVELNFKILNSSIIGVSYSHISNADIGNKNPGSDNILFNFRLSENF